jgi:hypothetical protein
MKQSRAKKRFERAAELALERFTDESLQQLTLRIEAELAYMSAHGGRSLDQLSDAELERELDQLVGIARKVKKQGETCPNP